MAEQRLMTQMRKTKKEDLIEVIQELKQEVKGLKHFISQCYIVLPVHQTYAQPDQRSVFGWNLKTATTISEEYIAKSQSFLSKKEPMEVEEKEGGSSDHDQGSNLMCSYTVIIRLKSVIAGIIDRINETIQLYHDCFAGRKRVKAMYTSKRLDYVVELLNPAQLEPVLRYFHCWSREKIQNRSCLEVFKAYIDKHDHNMGLLLLNLCISFLSAENEDLIDYQKNEPQVKYWNKLVEILRDFPENIPYGRKMFEQIRVDFERKWGPFREQNASDPHERLKQKQEILKQLRQRGEYLQRLDDAVEEYKRSPLQDIKELARKNKVRLGGLTTKIYRSKENRTRISTKRTNRNGFKVRVQDITGTNS